MNDLERYFLKNDGNLIHKWRHYFEVYDRHFQKFRNKEIVILEIGVFDGGSLQMWKHYFGPKAKIFGIDINPACKELEEENIEILIGSQSDPDFLRSVKQKIPPIDILIDDGGHMMRQQILTFDYLFDHVKSNGIYLCEDLCTSYWIKYGGGYKRKGTFIEYTKDLIDKLNAYHSEQDSLQVSEFTKSTNSLHFYDGIFIVEKKPRKKPWHEKRGKAYFKRGKIKLNHKQKLKVAILMYGNRLLRFFRLPGLVWR